MALLPGSDAPDFTLPSTSGRDFTLSRDAAGQVCILYFYPKDFTPGCTREACTFRDQFALFRKASVPVYGISRDDIETHRRFKAEHHLPFDLLADVDGGVCAKYEALLPLIRIPKRITYLLDAEHRIAAVYEDLFGAAGHIDAMLAHLTTHP
ncbi:peroxiredoxin [Rhodocaloribacter sp.]